MNNVECEDPLPQSPLHPKQNGVNCREDFSGHKQAPWQWVCYVPLADAGHGHWAQDGQVL